MVDNKSFKIYKIGLLKDNNIELLKEFRRGLKEIQYFSHLHIFWQNGNEVELTVIKKISDNNKGFSIDSSIIPNGASILDIKAYIPSEDRVKTTINPKYVEKIQYVKNTSEQAELEIVPIGFIKKVNGKTLIEIEKKYISEVVKLKGFSHFKIIWYFNRLDNKTLRKTLVCKPPYEAPKTGVFASRSPVRPNPIALTTCCIKNIDFDKGIIEVNNCDAFTGTPVVKLIPYNKGVDKIDQFEIAPWLSHWPKYIKEIVATNKEMEVKESDIQKLLNYSKPLNDLEQKEIVTVKEKKSNIKESINIIGARQNNLKNIDVSIPLGKLTVITGISGSGKSSLAFDTIYAEGQRRYMQSLSTSSRSAAGLLEKPDFDSIQNLLPAVAIEQKSITNNPRSTVGTVSDVYNYLRLLYARVGTRHCSSCGKEIKPQSVEALYKLIKNLLSNTKIEFYPGKVISENKPKYIYIVSKSNITTLTELISDSYLEGDGFITLVINDDTSLVVTERDSCTDCDNILFKMSPSLFSYNSPVGMCPTCNGIGINMKVDPTKVVNNPDISLLDGASSWYGDLRAHKKKPSANWFRNEVLALAEDMDIDLEIPWKSLPEDFKHIALYGSGDKIYEYSYNSGKNGRKGTISRVIGGAVNHIDRLFKNSKAGNSHEVYKQFLTQSPCNDCQGERLAADGRLVTLGGDRFPIVAALTVEKAYNWVKELPNILSKDSFDTVSNLVYELEEELHSMLKLGLYYLTLDRPVPTLSGGEAQRIKLASQLGCGLSGLLYVLDEPSIGLHPRDHKFMIDTMKQLRDAGNTVIVVEHDQETMLAADHIIDIGRGAGVNGGYIVAEGTPDNIINNPESITGEFIKSDKKITLPTLNNCGKYIKITGATLNNLKSVDVKFPIGEVSCVTGVSGSGKSSLIRGTLIPALQKLLNNMDIKSGEYSSITGVETIERVISVDQSSIGRSPKSIPATYIGLFDEIRKLFAKTDQAKIKKFKHSRFSFNDKGGRCPACEGAGKIKIDMNFLPDSWITCSDCEGKRYNRETLDVIYRGKNISEILEMDSNQAIKHFKGEKRVLGYLKTLKDVGLDYLKLGQSSRTLSGGEAQRIKLAKELTKNESGKNLYVLDEPTTGLHFSDVAKLLKVVHSLASLGNTVIIIEHNLTVIKTSNWIVDLGPSGGDKGGSIMGQGTPEDIKLIKNSFTGKYLKKEF